MTTYVKIKIIGYRFPYLSNCHLLNIRGLEENLKKFMAYYFDVTLFHKVNKYIFVKKIRLYKKSILQSDPNIIHFI